jgi:hypothetical protein
MGSDDWNDEPQVWVVRDLGGRQWKPASLAQVVAGLAARTITDDMEVRHAQASQWERIGALMTRMGQPRSLRGRGRTPCRAAHRCSRRRRRQEVPL